MQKDICTDTIKQSNLQSFIISFKRNEVILKRENIILNEEMGS